MKWLSYLLDITRKKEVDVVLVDWGIASTIKK
jgi:hypothetical protein